MEGMRREEVDGRGGRRSERQREREKNGCRPGRRYGVYEGQGCIVRARERLAGRRGRGGRGRRTRQREGVGIFGCENTPEMRM